ncbi:MAG: hypothetical protein U5P10_08525 [Spirochaetia bacterium]|nr:hypothetical protein [Spirochaetia bacterium]
MIAAASGLGYMILDSQELARSDRVFIGILTIGLLGLIIDTRYAMRIIHHHFPWIGKEQTVKRLPAKKAQQILPC